MDFEAHLCVPALSKAGCCLQKHHKGAGTHPEGPSTAHGREPGLGVQAPTQGMLGEPCPWKHRTSTSFGNPFLLVPYQTSFCLQAPEKLAVHKPTHKTPRESQIP